MSDEKGQVGDRPCLICMKKKEKLGVHIRSLKTKFAYFLSCGR
jgi:hypothetical protein